MWYSAKQGTTHRPTQHLEHCALSLTARRTRQRSRVRWPVFVMATSAEVCCCCCCCCTSSKESSTTSLASAPNSEAVSATRISRWLPPQVYFFHPATALRPTIVCLVYTMYDWLESQKHYTSKDTNVFHSESKTHLKLRCNCVWNSRYSKVPKAF